MNKTVTFNLNGLVFTIEEDGYVLLKNYLDQVKAYFAKQPDGLEIVTEIEARIAEKFRQQLDADQRQVLYASDVQQVMAEMGSVADFEAFDAEQEDDFGAPAMESSASRPNRLFRTKYNRVLAGVANGLAVYLNADVSLVRILFLLTTFFFAGFGLILYLVLWIALPETDERYDAASNDKEKLKRNHKLYRDVDEKVMGGVASGIAAYIQVDPLVIRLLFILALFWGGFGIIAYLILWIAMPAARTLAQKVEMRGQEANIANMAEARQPRDGEGERSTLNRLLALPIDLLRILTSALGSLIRTFGGLLRIVGGGFMLFIGAVMTFALVVAGSVLVGHFTGQINTMEVPFPLEAISGSTGSDVFISLLGFIVALMPILLVLYLGVRLLLNRKLFSRQLIYSGLGVWMVALLLSVFMAVKTVSFFQREGRVIEESTYLLPKAGTPTFDRLLNEEEDEVHYDWVRVNWYSQPGDTSIRVRKIFKAQGPSRDEARKNARMISLPFTHTDTLWQIGRSLRFKPNARFRFQSAEIELFVPKNRPVRIHNDLYWDHEVLGSDSLEFRTYELFVMTDEGLKCLSCKPRPKEEEAIEETSFEIETKNL